MCDSCNCKNPEAIAVINRPGLDALAYRLGNQASFLEAMRARLSSSDLPVLRGLTTRAANDPALALLDGWATVADVLSFYSERIANEGYLRTATERRSVLELARLVGYALRPGVAATAYLAFTVDEKQIEPVEIQVGTRTQSIPGPGELPQTFETTEKLVARARWNALAPRMSQPQTRASVTAAGTVGNDNRVWLKGIATNLKQGDPLLIAYNTEAPTAFRITEVIADARLDRTEVRFRTWRKKPGSQGFEVNTRRIVTDLIAKLTAIVTRYRGPEADALNLSRSTEMYARVESYLNNLLGAATRGLTFPELEGYVKTDTLINLGTEQRVAEESAQYSKLRPWLTGLVKELGDAIANAAQARAELMARAFATTDGSDIAFADEPNGSVASAPANDPAKAKGASEILIGGLTKAGSIPPRNTLYLERSVSKAFQARADAGLRVLGALREALKTVIHTAVANTKVNPDVTLTVYALRIKVSPFGHNAPLIAAIPEGGGQVTYAEWAIRDSLNTGETDSPTVHDTSYIHLDNEYAIQPGSWVVIDEGNITAESLSAVTPQTVTNPSLSGYGLAGRSTKLDFGSEAKVWLTNTGGTTEVPALLTFVRKVVVFAGSEVLPLAEAPIETPICGGETDEIELDGVYPDLEAGRWVIVAGERADINVPVKTATSETAIVGGIRSAELVMVSEVVQTYAANGKPVVDDGKPEASSGNIVAHPGESNRTFIRLAKKLNFCFKRDSVTIYANVAKASHGETRKEALGGGDAAQALQTFALRQPPLTFVPAPNPSGVDSTLKVYVNNVQWREAETLAGLEPNDRKFITRIDDDAASGVGKTSIVFGNGVQGARLPSGQENVRAIYRSGIGKPGNVRAEQISLLLDRPLGVNGVINPLRASGGADKEGQELARRNAPLAVMALDRLLSVQDYADFARTFAGIGKSAARRIALQGHDLVHVTIAGADDIPIDPTSDLYRNLLQALRRYGDPYQNLKVETRELALLIISARVRIMDDYLWDVVAPAIRAKLLTLFGFERRELGQDALLSEAISAIHAVRGVAFVDVDVFGSIPEKKVDSGVRRLLTSDEITQAVLCLASPTLAGCPPNLPAQPQVRVQANLAGLEGGALRPAQLVLLSPGLPETLVLNQIT